MKITRSKLIGTLIILLGIAMLFIGGSLFSYSGPRLDPIVSDIGKYSFFLWLPTIIVGVVIFRWKK